jgi:hypothetical protein
VRGAVVVLVALGACVRAPARRAEPEPASREIQDALAGLEVVVRRTLPHAELVLLRDAAGDGRLALARPDAPLFEIPCDRLVGAWGLWIDDVDADGRADAIVALRKTAKFDPIVDNRLHVYAFDRDRCVPLWRGTRLAGRFVALATVDGDRGALVVEERLSPERRRVARYRWSGFGYAVDEVLWEGIGPAPPEWTAGLTRANEVTP